MVAVGAVAAGVLSLAAVAGPQAHAHRGAPPVATDDPAQLLLGKALMDRTSGRAVEGAAPRCDRQPKVQVRKDKLLTLRPLVACTVDWSYGHPTIRITDGPDHGNVDVYSEWGEVRYAPKPGYRGPDKIGYVVTNGAGSSAERTWKIDVTAAANTPPVCLVAEGELYDRDGSGSVSGHLRARRGASRMASVICWDLESDPLTVVVKGAPSSGTLTPHPLSQLVPHAVYTPAPGTAAGTKDQAMIAVRDQRGLESKEFLIGFDVVGAEANLPPECAGSYSGDPDQWQSIATGLEAVVADAACADPERDPMTYSVLTAPAGAEVRYDPDPVIEPFNLIATASASEGHGTFTYVGVDDRGAQSEVQTVGLRFQSAGAPPSCTEPRVPVAAATRTEFEIVCTDPDGDFVYTFLSPGTSGSRLLTRNGDVEVGLYEDGRLPLVYTPDPGFWGTDSFLLEGFDMFNSDLSRVTLDVAAPLKRKKAR